MTDHTAPERQDGTIDDDEPTGPVGAEVIRSYDIDGGVVSYDVENPLTWVEISNSTRLDDCA